MLTVSMLGNIRQKERLEAFSLDVCNDLFSDLEPYGHINIRIKRKLDAYGYCWPPEEDAIEIEVRNEKDIRTVALTIAHELVHARQFLTESAVCEDEAEKLEYELVDLYWEQ